MNTLQEFLIKSADLENDLWGLGAGGAVGSLGGLRIGNEIYAHKLKPHREFINSVVDASRKSDTNLMRIPDSKNFDNLATFTRLLRKNPTEAIKYMANATDARMYSSAMESMRDLDKPNISQRARDLAKLHIKSQVATMSLPANKLSFIYDAARQFGVPKEHADTLMDAIKYSDRLDRISKITKPVAKRLRGIGLLAGLLAGSGAGLGISRLISD